FKILFKNVPVLENPNQEKGVASINDTKHFVFTSIFLEEAARRIRFFARSNQDPIRVGFISVGCPFPSGQISLFANLQFILPIQENGWCSAIIDKTVYQRIAPLADANL